MGTLPVARSPLRYYPQRDTARWKSHTMTITHDESTWPTGDKVWDVCRAIARAEGANVEGDNPDRLNNPGDISDGARLYGSEFHSGSAATRFPDKVTGWNWLYGKVSRISQGESVMYPLSLTWIGLAKKWAGNCHPWALVVTDTLGVSAFDTLADYFGRV